MNNKIYLKLFPNYFLEVLFTNMTFNFCMHRMMSVIRSLLMPSISDFAMISSVFDLENIDTIWAPFSTSRKDDIHKFIDIVQFVGKIHVEFYGVWQSFYLFSFLHILIQRQHQGLPHFRDLRCKTINLISDIRLMCKLELLFLKERVQRDKRIMKAKINIR